MCSACIVGCVNELYIVILMNGICAESIEKILICNIVSVSVSRGHSKQSLPFPFKLKQTLCVKCNEFNFSI